MLVFVYFFFMFVFVEYEKFVEFLIKFGIFMVKKVFVLESMGVLGEGKLFIELDFFMIDFVDCYFFELLVIFEIFNGVFIVSVYKLMMVGDFIVIFLIFIFVLLLMMY